MRGTLRFKNRRMNITMLVSVLILLAFTYFFPPKKDGLANKSHFCILIVLRSPESKSQERKDSSSNHPFQVPWLLVSWRVVIAMIGSEFKIDTQNNCLEQVAPFRYCGYFWYLCQISGGVPALYLTFFRFFYNLVSWNRPRNSIRNWIGILFSNTTT